MPSIMPFAQLHTWLSSTEIPSTGLARPKFHHRCTEDRLREGSARTPSFFISSRIAKNRKSVFRELGLDTDEPGGPYWSEQAFSELTGLASPTSTHAPDEPDNDNAGAHGSRTETETHQGRQQQQQQQQEGQDVQAEPPQSPTSQPASGPTRWYSRLTTRVRRPRIRTVSTSAPQPPSLSTVTRLSTMALLIAVLLPGFSYYKRRHEASPNGGADASVTIHAAAGASSGPVLELGAEMPAAVCKRWAYPGG